MVRRSLSDVIEGRLITPGSTISTPLDEAVMAVDVVDTWAALFRFSVEMNGEWYAGCQRATIGWNHRWEEMGSGGFRGDGWEMPWQPPEQGWDGRGLFIFGHTAQGVADDEGLDHSFDAFCGFAAKPVAAIRVTCDSKERLVKIESELGGFAVAAIGSGDVQLQALDDDGNPFGDLYDYLSSIRMYLDP
jgi:hypothetical protein